VVARLTSLQQHEAGAKQGTHKCCAGTTTIAQLTVAQLLKPFLEYVPTAEKAILQVQAVCPAACMVATCLPIQISCVWGFWSPHSEALAPCGPPPAVWVTTLPCSVGANRQQLPSLLQAFAIVVDVCWSVMKPATGWTSKADSHYTCQAQLPIWRSASWPWWLHWSGSPALRPASWTSPSCRFAELKRRQAQLLPCFEAIHPVINDQPLIDNKQKLQAIESGVQGQFTEGLLTLLTGLTFFSGRVQAPHRTAQMFSNLVL